MSQQSWQQLFVLMGEQFGLGALTLDEDNCCVLKIDEILVNLQISNDHLIMVGLITQIPQNPDSQFLEDLLATNLYWGAAGCSLALEPNHRALLLQDKLTPDTDLPTVLQRLENLVNAVEQLQTSLTHEKSQVPPTEQNNKLFSGQRA